MAGRQRSFSRLTLEALELLSAQIRLARKDRRMTQNDLAVRVGVARSTVQRIEKGDPKIDIGLMFEACVIMGVPLFEPDTKSLAPQMERLCDKLAVMPARIRTRASEVNDDF